MRSEDIRYSLKNIEYRDDENGHHRAVARKEYPGKKTPEENPGKKHQKKTPKENPKETRGQ
jgi:hypothetical protein